MKTEGHHARLLVVSDIHGHLEGLDMLLDMAEYRPKEDRLILLGDFLDAGPGCEHSLLAAKRLAEGGATALLGNRETAVLRAAASGSGGAGELRAQDVRDGWRRKELSVISNPDAIDWLQSLPGYLELDGYLFVHAGIRPHVPLKRQTLSDLTEIREDFWQAPDLGYPHTVIFGHTPTFKLGAAPGELWLGPGRIGIDTGAKYGYRLTLLDVHHRLTYSCTTSSGGRYGQCRIRKIHG